MRVSMRWTLALYAEQNVSSSKQISLQPDIF